MDALTYIEPIPARDEFRPQALEWFYMGVGRLSPYRSPEPGQIPGAGIAITVTVAVVPALCTALGAWLGSRNGRKVRIKIGDIEAEAQTREEVERLLVVAQKAQQEIQQRNQQPKLFP